MDGVRTGVFAFGFDIYSIRFHNTSKHMLRFVNELHE